MLVLSRKSQEAVVVGGAGGLVPLLTVTVLEITGTRVRLGFEVDAVDLSPGAVAWARGTTPKLICPGLTTTSVRLLAETRSVVEETYSGPTLM